jgi:hypothetical protein
VVRQCGGRIERDRSEEMRNKAVVRNEWQRMLEEA